MKKLYFLFFACMCLIHVRAQHFTRDEYKNSDNSIINATSLYMQFDEVPKLCTYAYLDELNIRLPLIYKYEKYSCSLDSIVEVENKDSYNNVIDIRRFHYDYNGRLYQVDRFTDKPNHRISYKYYYTKAIDSVVFTEHYTHSNDVRRIKYDLDYDKDNCLKSYTLRIRDWQQARYKPKLRVTYLYDDQGNCKQCEYFHWNFQKDNWVLYERQKYRASANNVLQQIYYTIFDKDKTLIQRRDFFVDNRGFYSSDLSEKQEDTWKIIRSFQKNNADKSVPNSGKYEFVNYLFNYDPYSPFEVSCMADKRELFETGDDGSMTGYSFYFDNYWEPLDTIHIEYDDKKNISKRSIIFPVEDSYQKEEVENQYYYNIKAEDITPTYFYYPVYGKKLCIKDYRYALKKESTINIDLDKKEENQKYKLFFYSK
ncbi:MAG: hypothetical protein ACEPOW_11030 [Bacteroidales bacterium]